MHPVGWLFLTIVALVSFGVVGLLQKLSTELVSAEAAFIWFVVGFFLLEPFVYSGRATFHYAFRDIALGIGSGVLNAFGSWTILAAMKSGGKASIVVPFTAVYPMVVCLAAPFILREHITLIQGGGIFCGLGAIFLLAG